MRIEEIVIHCTYTPPEMDIGLAEIDRWHKEKGWSGCGYHRIIRRDGQVEIGKPLDEDAILEPNEIGAHALGHNRHSVGVVLVGGMKVIDEAERVPQCNYTQKQWRTLEDEIDWLEKKYGPVKILGHNDVNPLKACPVFGVRAWRYG